MREFSGAGLRAQALAEASYKPPVARRASKDLLTLSEVHELTGISTKTLAVMCKSGELPALKKGHWLVHKDVAAAIGKGNHAQLQGEETRDQTDHYLPQGATERMGD